MKEYKPFKGTGIIYILLSTILIDAILFFIILRAKTFELVCISQFVMVVFNIYQLYYILLSLTVKYSADNENLYIKGIFGMKKVVIPFSNIKKYKKLSGTIKGFKISGYGRDNFAFGRSIISKIGTTRMFVTSNKNIFYFEADGINFGISPENYGEFENMLIEHNIPMMEWEHTYNKKPYFYKERKFWVLIILTSLVIVILTLNPFILYLRNKLPLVMPLGFDRNLNPVAMGTGKQFAFRQMMYGALNMALFFCMYYAFYFCAKYDRKTAYVFLYVSLAISIIFLSLQIFVLNIYH